MAIFNIKKLKNNSQLKDNWIAVKNTISTRFIDSTDLAKYVGIFLAIYIYNSSYCFQHIKIQIFPRS